MTKLNAQELLELLETQWASTKDIMKIGAVGENRAYLIKKQIQKQVETQGKLLPSGLVPMEFVVDYFQININYLKKISKR